MRRGLREGHKSSLGSHTENLGCQPRVMQVPDTFEEGPQAGMTGWSKEGEHRR